MGNRGLMSCCRKTWSMICMDMYESRLAYVCCFFWLRATRDEDFLAVERSSHMMLNVEFNVSAFRSRHAPSTLRARRSRPPPPCWIPLESRTTLLSVSCSWQKRASAHLTRFGSIVSSIVVLIPLTALVSFCFILQSPWPVSGVCCPTTDVS